MEVSSIKDDLEGETHTVWQMLLWSFAIFHVLAHPLKTYDVLATVYVTRTTWSYGIGEAGHGIIPSGELKGRSEVQKNLG